MLDAGITIEPHRAGAIDKLAQLNPSQWESSSVAVIRENMTSGAKGIPLKYAYGSNFPYREAAEQLGCKIENVGLLPSFALGGLSTVWGAALLPYSQLDLADWPFGRDTLLPHYAEVESITGIAGFRDDLESLFALHSCPTTLRGSKQAGSFLRDLQRNRETLSRAGITFGNSRLAVQGQDADQGGCVYCGLCMYGCPYGYIYNSATTVADLQKNSRFTYKRDVVVERLEELDGKVRIHAHHFATREQLIFEADRVYLAAGVIPTTRILLESLQAYEQPVYIQDSQYFLLPLLRRKKIKGVDTESLHTLSQLFMEIDDPDVSPNLVHLQIYSYNDLITGALQKSLGPLGKITPLVRELQERLLIVQGYLHSRHSAKIKTTLRKNSILHLEAQENPETRKVLRRVVGKLLKQSLRFDALPLFPMLQAAQPGRGFHSGGSFPMRDNPGPFESDLLGRPHSFERVHIVDATCFPTIPATTITMSAMANAHRIGSAEL